MDMIPSASFYILTFEVIVGSQPYGEVGGGGGDGLGGA